MKKKAVKIAAAMICLIVLTVSVEMVKLGIKTSAIRNDYSSIYDDPKYSEPVSVDGVNVITQDVSCGYAVIQMFSSWDGGNITEKDLYDEYGKVVTSTGNAFCDEMNKRFPDYTTEMYEYQTNTELIDLVYESLRNGVPVPFEWAALYGDEWTLHYSLVTGMDIPSDTVTIANPYGYYETISIGEFLDRTSFEAYEHMSLFLKLGFAFGVFEKNTVFIVTQG